MICFAHLSQCTSWLRPGGNDFQSLNLISRKALSEIVFRHLAQSGARKWLKISDFDFKFNANEHRTSEILNIPACILRMSVKSLEELNLDGFLFRTRMCAIILFRQMTEVQVCVDLGCRNIGVTEKLLNRSNIAA